MVNLTLEDPEERSKEDKKCNPVNQLKESPIRKQKKQRRISPQKKKIQWGDVYTDATKPSFQSSAWPYI